MFLFHYLIDILNNEKLDYNCILKTRKNSSEGHINDFMKIEICILIFY